jgi:hypothetical protein
MKMRKTFMWYAPVVLFSACFFIFTADALTVNGTIVPKTGGYSCILQFSCVPATEDIGGMQLDIHTAKTFNLTEITASSPSQGAWSQVSPVLDRKDSQVLLSAINPAFMKSSLTDSIEMFQLNLVFTGTNFPQTYQQLFDSLNIKSLFSTDGKDIKGTLNFGALAVSKHRVSNNALCNYVFKARRIHELTFSIKNDAVVKARVIDAKGKVISVLADSKMAAGMHTVGWDGSAGNHSIAASGVYFIQLETGSFTYNKKVSHVR